MDLKGIISAMSISFVLMIGKVIIPYDDLVINTNFVQFMSALTETLMTACENCMRTVDAVCLCIQISLNVPN